MALAIGLVSLLLFIRLTEIQTGLTRYTTGCGGKKKFILHSETVLASLGCTVIFLYSRSYFVLAQLDWLHE